MYMSEGTPHKKRRTEMDDFMKEMRLHTLRGDLQQMGMEGFGKAAMRRRLKSRYVTEDSGIGGEEFEAVLAEEHAKVRAWHIAKMD
jgi:hypothetical protein